MIETNKSRYRWWCRNRYVRRTAMVIYFSLLFPVGVVVYAIAAVFESTRHYMSKFGELWEEYN